MKKFIAGILLVIYFTVSTGVVVSVHWCMDKLASVELGHSEQKECGKCGMHIVDNNGCCKDDVKFFKMKADQAFAKIVLTDFSLHLLPLLHESYQPLKYERSLQEQHPPINGPPLSKQDTYLKNCVFRI